MNDGGHPDELEIEIVSGVGLPDEMQKAIGTVIGVEFPEEQVMAPLQCGEYVHE